MSTPISAQRIGRLSAIYMIGSFAPQLIGLLLTPIFTRYLAPDQMGIVNQALRLVVPLTFIVQLGFSAVLRGEYFRISLEQRPTLVRTVLIGQTAIAAALCGGLLLLGLAPAPSGLVAQELLPRLPVEPWQVYLVWALVVSQAFFDALTSLACGVIQLNERAAASVGVYFARYLSQAALGLIAVVGLGWLGVGRQATIVAACALAASIALVFVARHARGSFDAALFRKTFTSGLAFVPHSLAGFMPLTVTSWLLGRYWSSAANGIFAAAQQLPQMTDIMMNAISTAAYPTLANLMRDGSPEAKRRQSRVYTLLILAVTGISVTVAVLSPIAIRILYAPAYHEAIQYAPILALAWLFTGMYLIVSQPVYFAGGGWWLSSASTTAAIAHLAVSIPMIERFALFGAAWSLVAGNFVLFVVAAAAGNRLYPLPWERRKLTTCLITAVAIGMADVYLCRDMNWLTSIPVKVALLSTWFVGLRITGVVSGAELARAAGWIRIKLPSRRAVDSA